MKALRARVSARTSLASPWQADTLFGHLCWVVAHTEGEDALQEFLEPFKNGNPPFLLSDGFPHEYLPVPLSVHLLYPETEENTKNAYHLARALKKVRWLELGELKKVQAGKKPFQDIRDIEEAAKRRPQKTVSVPHAQVSRATGTTGEEGNYFEIPEYYVLPLKENEPPYISVYARILQEGWRERLVQLLESLSGTGYGRRKAVGKGQFRVVSWEEVNLGEVRDANGFVALSNFCPAANDPADGYYQTLVKYGKLGEELAHSGNPFKRPLIMLKAGSVFRTERPPTDRYGRMVTGLSVIQSVVHYAFALPVPLHLPHAAKG